MGWMAMTTHHKDMRIPSQEWLCRVISNHELAKSRFFVSSRPATRRMAKEERIHTGMANQGFLDTPCFSAKDQPAIMPNIARQ